MNLDEFNYNVRMLEQTAYRIIRRTISDFENNANNDEIGGYVKGVVALQAEMYKNYEREYKNYNNL